MELDHRREEGGNMETAFQLLKVGTILFGGIADNVVSCRKEIHSDNLATKTTSYAMIITAIIGFLGVPISLMRM